MPLVAALARLLALRRGDDVSWRCRGVIIADDAKRSTRMAISAGGVLLPTAMRRQPRAFLK